MNGEQISMVTPKQRDGHYQVLVLERVVEGETPEHCVHGRAQCMGPCGGWVWLGSESVKVIQSGEAVPFCQQCAALAIPVGSQAPIGNVNDHQRKDGPHE